MESAARLRLQLACLMKTHEPKRDEPHAVDHRRPPLIERNLSMELVRVTERAAIPPRAWPAAATRGRPTRRPSTPCAASSTACRSRQIVIGEGERDEAPMLFIGEKVGNRQGPKWISRSIRSKARRSAPRVCPMRSPSWRWPRPAAAQRARRLHGQDRHRPRLPAGRDRSRRAGRRQHPRLAKAKGVKPEPKSRR